MKKIWLTFAGSCLIALAAVQAQERSDTTQTQPSSDYRNESGTQSNTSTVNGLSGTQGQYSNSWRDEDRESINREDLPAGLLKTLESDEYKGWENATIYRNKVTDDYMLIIQDNGTAKTFYFDQEGKSQTNLNSSDTNSSDTNSSGYNSSSSTGNQNSSSTGSDNNSSGSNNSSMNNSSMNGSGTTGTPPPSSGYRTDDSSQSTGVEVQTTQPSPSTSWNNDDRIIIVNEDIPAGLRVTLQGDQFKGWENSTIFQNRKTNEYMIEIRDGSNAKVYYFDSEGKLLSNTGNND